MKLQAGDKAPEFEGLDQYGKKISLGDFKGKKLVLFFYPKDNTPGCTAEACNLRDNYDHLKKKGFELVGISVDDLSSHKKFAEKFKLPFSLISDTNKNIVNAYGVWGEKKMYGKTYEGTHRVTFIINEKAHIEQIFEKVNTKDHANQIIENKK
ncbi:MAG: thioredoxin-dependent thiol peroxidase [Bacteroidetes bacterium HGW-Bacteroidetes-21]|nr:MAG: thioredoxin-dependent thiol peroxidase [Bacteroidetes bacterium HGW-Bacteroidetes-21]